jgi:kynurenine formamidase
MPLSSYICGANFIFQLLDGCELGRPAGLLGVERIYDLGRMRDAPIEVPMYKYFIESAFGKDEEAWKPASPATHVSKADFAWRKAKVAALAKIDEDQLVDVNQRDLMWK